MRFSSYSLHGETVSNISTFGIQSMVFIISREGDTVHGTLFKLWLHYKVRHYNQFVILALAFSQRTATSSVGLLNPHEVYYAIILLKLYIGLY